MYYCDCCTPRYCSSSKRTMRHHRSEQRKRGIKVPFLARSKKIFKVETDLILKKKLAELNKSLDELTASYHQSNPNVTLPVDAEDYPTD